jgi:hypothetical protein
VPPPHPHCARAGIFPSWFIDYGREAGQKAILNSIERNVGDSAADGLFLDNFPDIPFTCDDGNRLPHAPDANCTAERSQLKNNIPKHVSKVTAASVNAYAAGKNDTLLRLGELIRQKTGGGMYVAFVAGSSPYGPDRLANTAVFNYNAPMTPATLAQQVSPFFFFLFLFFSPSVCSRVVIVNIFRRDASVLPFTRVRCHVMQCHNQTYGSYLSSQSLRFPIPNQSLRFPIPDPATPRGKMTLHSVTRNGVDHAFCHSL